MRTTALKMLLVVTLPLTFVVGCAHTRPDEAALYGPAPDLTLTTTSDRPVTRVYPSDVRPEGIIWPPAAAPSGAADGDWALSEEIRGVLTTDKSLAPYPSDVSAIVDKNNKGLVRLRGYVPNNHEKDRLHDRFAQIPGVAQLDDQIEVGLPDRPG